MIYSSLLRMKKISLAITASVALSVSGWCASDTFTIFGNQTITTPPVVDATNFVNLGSLSIFTISPFDFSNVQNYTNRGFMDNSFSGFRFDNAPSGSGYRKMAKTFYNAPSVTNGSGRVTGGTHVLVSATNVINRGLLQVGSSGLVSIEGKRVDISRSKVITDVVSSPGATDNYWFFGTNDLNPSESFVLDFPNAIYDVIYPPNFTNSFFMQLIDFGLTPEPALTASEFTYEAGSNRTVQIVFVRNFNTNLTVSIEAQGGTPRRLGVPTVEWSAAGTNVLGGAITNALYLTDTYGSNPTNILLNFGGIRRPANFTLSSSSFSFGTGDVGVPFTDKASDFWGSPDVVSNAIYSAWGATIAGGTSSGTTSPRFSGGRVEISASEVFDTSLAQLSAASYIKVNSTNHLVTPPLAFPAFSAPYMDLALGSTNGQLNVQSLVPETLPGIIGSVDVYSARWTNSVDFGGSTNSVVFNVILVDSALVSEIRPTILDLSLRSTNVVISDVLNVQSNLQIKAQSLTIADTGLIGMGYTTTPWPSAAPDIRTLTNSGTIYSDHDLFFKGINANGSDRPYRTFWNAGLAQAAALTVQSTNIVNSGLLYAGYGPVTLTASSNVVLGDGGSIGAPFADLTISCQNFAVTNHFLEIGRAFNLSVTGSLSAGPNSWTVYDGFNLWSKPTTGDLAQVSVTQSAQDFQEMTSTWAAKDFGPVATGFTNNAALGSLTLDGGLYSLFIFNGTGPSSNALYVDVLTLKSYATNFDAGSNLVAVSVSPGMKIYFGKAFIDDGLGGLTEVTSQLAGNSGGQFGNVPHSGPLTPAKPAVIPSPVLRVAVEKSPTVRSLISWETPPSVTNYLYCSPQPFGASWQLVTNFVSGPAGGTVIVPDPGLTGSKFYKLQIKAPGQ